MNIENEDFSGALRFDGTDPNGCESASNFVLYAKLGKMYHDLAKSFEVSGIDDEFARQFYCNEIRYSYQGIKEVNLGEMFGGMKLEGIFFDNGEGYINLADRYQIQVAGVSSGGNSTTNGGNSNEVDLTGTGITGTTTIASGDCSLSLDVDPFLGSRELHIERGDKTLPPNKTLTLRAELRMKKKDAKDCLRKKKSKTIETDFFVRLNNGTWSRVCHEKTKVSNLKKGESHVEKNCQVIILYRVLTENIH